MNKSLHLGLLFFGVSYVALSMLVAWALPDEGWLASNWTNFFLLSVAVAGCSVFLGLVGGRLTPNSVGICSFVIQVAVVATTLGLLVALSSRGTGTFVWPPLLGAALARNWLGLSASFVAGIIWPVVWVLVLRRAAARLAPGIGS